MDCRGTECLIVRRADSAGLLDLDGFVTMTAVCERVTKTSGVIATQEICPFALSGTASKRSGAPAIDRLIEAAKGDPKNATSQN